MLERAIEAMNPIGTTRGSDGRILWFYCRLCGSIAPEFQITINSDMQFSAGCLSCGYSLEIFNTGLARKKYEKAAHETTRRFPL
ncbi:MAG: hypothetical protein HY006_00510 [Candidatus Sungbacteria bacterium]|nr:hypothetical protein [Candidatus Sungbacteria bacterium]